MNRRKCIVYVDQSGKIENTEKPTILAFSNHVSRSIMISSSEKRKVQEFFRDASKPHMFVYKTFSTLTFLMVKEYLADIEGIVIDREYKGKESLIKKYLVESVRRCGLSIDPDSIYFDEIGKRNKAHIKAVRTFRKTAYPDLVVTSRDLISWLL